jgi:TetR/AcrR family transcriptional regulator, transcriptional repressor for nem operon
MGKPRSQTRDAILDQTEQLMLDEGYAAVSYRRVAKKATVSTSVVQYYFPTIDELFIAVLRRRTGAFLDDLVDEIHAHPDRALHIIWDHNHDQHTTALHLEFLALTNHRDKVRLEMEEGGQVARRIQLDALSEGLKRLGGEAEKIPPDPLLFLVIGIPQMMLFDRAIGLSTGHAKILALAKDYLERLEPSRRQRKSAPRTAPVKAGTKASHS